MLRSATVILALVALASAGRRGPLPADLVHIPDLERSLGITDRIVGGDIVEPNSIPFQISMQFSGILGGFSHSCGGSVYDASTIITAAHCCVGQSASNVQVVAGEHDLSRNDRTEQTRAVSRIVDHEDFSSFTLKNDMCLLKLASPLNLNNEVSPVALPTQGEIFSDSGRAIVSGWGTLRSGGSIPDELHAVEVPLVSDRSCEDSYGSTRFGPTEMLCAGEEGKDSCQGDSGGPLICKDGDVQCGVVSWGIGCADAGYPGVYAEVAIYIDWISNNA